MMTVFINPFHKSTNVPSANIAETDTEYQLEFAVPDMKKEIFRIAVDQGILTIGAETSENTKENEGNYTRKEYSFSSFSRSFCFLML